MIEPKQHLKKVVRTEKVDRGGRIGLDRNERVTPLSHEHFQKILATLTPDMLNGYPDVAPLMTRLEKLTECPQDWISATCGSDAVIRHAYHAYVSAGDTVVFPSPTYAMYGVYAEIVDGRAIQIAYNSDRTLDVGAMLEAIKMKPRLVGIANPDQPTGTVLPEQELRRIAAAARDVGALFLIDEAYFPAYPHSAISMVREFENLAVARSFSKLWGMAGLRLGFVIARPPVIEALQKVRGAHEVNAMAVAIGSYMLDHPEIMQAYTREIEEGRGVLREFARRENLGFPQCPTNFQLLELPPEMDGVKVVRDIKEAGFLVKGGYTEPSMRGCIRVTLDGPEMMGRFTMVLGQTLGLLRSN